MASLPEPSLTIPLQATLLYESGKQVDDTQILKITQNKPPSLELRYINDNKWCYEGEIHFRLEKVSLRNDGQRFKLEINADTDSDWIADTHRKVTTHSLVDHPQHTQFLTTWLQSIHGCCTIPINVLSKRKNNTSSADTSKRANSARVKRTRTEPVHAPSPSADFSRIVSALDSMNRKMTDIMDIVQLNSSRLSSLENQIASFALKIPDNQPMPSFTRLTSLDIPDLRNDQSLPLPLLTAGASSWEMTK